MAPLIDCNVHLWDQTSNPIFWLTDRSLVRDMLGDYDSLPDVYTLADYQHEVAGRDVRGIVWSDAGADDPIAAAGWVQHQCDELDVPGALVTLGDPAADGFADLVERFRALFQELGDNVTTLGSQVGDASQQIADWLRNRSGGIRRP